MRKFLAPFLFITISASIALIFASCGGGGGGGTSASSQLGDLKGTYIVISRSSEAITARGVPGDGAAVQQNGSEDRVIFFGNYNSKDMFIRLNFSKTVSEGFELTFDNGFTIGESNPIRLTNTSFPIDGFPIPEGDRPMFKIGNLTFLNNQVDTSFASETKRWTLTLEKKTSDIPTAAQFADSSLLYSFLKTYDINPSSWPETTTTDGGASHQCVSGTYGVANSSVWYNPLNHPIIFLPDGTVAIVVDGDTIFIDGSWIDPSVSDRWNASGTAQNGSYTGTGSGFFSGYTGETKVTGLDCSGSAPTMKLEFNPAGFGWMGWNLTMSPRVGF